MIKQQQQQQQQQFTFPERPLSSDSNQNYWKIYFVILHIVAEKLFIHFVT